MADAAETFDTHHVAAEWTATFTWAEMAGRLEAVKITVVPNTAGSGIVPSDLRAASFANLLKAQRALIQQVFTMSAQALPDDPRRSEWARVGELAGKAKKGRPVSDDELEQVADVYREAYRMGANPVVAVADALKIARSTAAKRVIAARRAGFLPPATAGKASA